MESEQNNLLLIAILLNSALYLLCVFVLGIVWGMPLASILATATFGLAFLGYVTQAMSLPISISLSLVGLSWGLAIWAGAILIPHAL